MTEINAMRLQLLLQQEQQKILDSNKYDAEIELPVVQARGLCWLVFLAEAHEDQANDAEKRGDTEQAMGWYADAQRLRDVINLVTKIDIPYLEEENSLSNNPQDLRLSIPDAALNTNFNIDHSVNHLNTNIQNLNNDESVQKKNDKIVEKFEEMSKVLESHCENITRLIKIHDEKLVEQEKIDAKIFEKIKTLESYNKEKKKFKEMISKSYLYQSSVTSNCKEKEKANQYNSYLSNAQNVLYRK